MRLSICVIEERNTERRLRPRVKDDLTRLLLTLVIMKHGETNRDRETRPSLFHSHAQSYTQLLCWHIGIQFFVILHV